MIAELSEPGLYYILKAIEESTRAIRENTEIQRECKQLLQEILWEIPAIKL